MSCRDLKLNVQFKGDSLPRVLGKELAEVKFCVHDAYNALYEILMEDGLSPKLLNEK